MATHSSIALLCLIAVGSLGCRVENPPTRREQAQEKKFHSAASLPPPPRPMYNTDDAALVEGSCGTPLSDTVVAIYSKLHNGPVRRMVYRGRQFVTLEYVPSLPPAHQTSTPAPFPPPEQAPPTLVPGAVWRFYGANMEHEEAVTAKRLELYLPCAAQALSRDF